MKPVDVLNEARSPEGSGESPASSPVDAPAFFDAPTWKAFQHARSLEDAAQAWLVLQCGIVAERGLSAVVMMASEAGQALKPVAVWPIDAPAGARLLAIAETAAHEARGVLSMADGAIVAHPIMQDAPAMGAVAVHLPRADQEDARRVMRHLQWGLGLLRDRIRARDQAMLKLGVGRSAVVLDVLALVMQTERAKAAATAAATELASRLDCDRVSIGRCWRHKTKVLVISHTANFGEQMSLVRLLGAAMDEAIDQRAIIAHPPLHPGEPLATRDHAELSRALAGAHVLTVPMFMHGQFLGAITFERPEHRPFLTPEIEVMAALGSALGPVLEEKRLNDRWLVTKFAASVLRGLKWVFGPSDLIVKMMGVALLAAGLYLSVATGDYKVHAPAAIEGLIRRAIVAPADGFIKEAPARAGDSVSAGQLLASLEDRDLTLERLRWVTERQQRRIEYEKALAERQRATIGIIKAQIDQSEAQIQLIDEQLARIQLRSPFEALVVSGDLSQQIGAAVTRGQTLFELAPLDVYRVNLSVDESQVIDVTVGQKGNVLFASIPEQPFPLEIEKVTPVAETRDGRNVFRVEARLTETSPRLRPGMDGVAKIDVDQRLLIWIWSRSLVNWFRVAAWSWVG